MNPVGSGGGRGEAIGNIYYSGSPAASRARSWRAESRWLVVRMDERSARAPCRLVTTVTPTAQVTAVTART
jgi:hypothetical protein